MAAITNEPWPRVTSTGWLVTVTMLLKPNDRSLSAVSDCFFITFRYRRLLQCMCGRAIPWRQYSQILVNAAINLPVPQKVNTRNYLTETISFPTTTPLHGVRLTNEPFEVAVLNSA
jgi:hypothetical protein